jgi:hypothetical protein
MPRELKLVSLEPSGSEDFEYDLKLFQLVCKGNCNAKYPVTPFSTALGEGGTVGQIAHRGSGNSNTS